MKIHSLHIRILTATCAAILLSAGSLVAASAPAAAATAPQASYKSPDEALAALTSALKAQDPNEIFAIFGPELKTVLSADPAERKSEFDAFLKAYAQGVKLVPAGEGKVIVSVGEKAWPLPFPLVKGKDGTWSFDTAAGREEILNRRVGDNELNAINVLLRYVDAQRQYASHDWDGSGVLAYAQRLASTPGKKDGLYWDSSQDGTVSPLGEAVDEAKAAGYRPVKAEEGQPRAYEGYVFRILTKQGPGAPLGRYNYVINGKMIAGFGLVGYPLKYGNSGIMTFIVNQQGIVYQKDLGPNTAALGAAMSEYNPENGWKPAEVEVTFSEVTK